MYAPPFRKTDVLPPILDKVIDVEINNILKKHVYPEGQLIANMNGTCISLFVGSQGQLDFEVKQENGLIIPIKLTLNALKFGDDDFEIPKSFDDEREVYRWLTRVRAWCILRLPGN